ncbi:helicase-exonuclease AddAB subunit AddA [Paenibacillus sp. MY03]|uniref:helicase-exonuclease AddAB subunit AddA n=1 Tax=Paenibacillus sp. MY03 TaxID=302980 RepID=UPI000B3C98E8|nr:helicase-exonuclease AddAB subunit AddA [Paenibacillus sp. MY03]OUS77531.1 helicase-exonuclease AddAB subunit AddA [Paenibacillus sp. MY03]
MSNEFNKVVATLPPKPENSTWTDDQWKAVVTGGRNVLVAAAAGSGKTAVLVERIIRKISSDTDVDKLLVATFTKAAAAEMKERITLALEKELEAQPDSDHLRRQLALMGRASITTLHSFCMDVIRRHYPLIGLDPGFRIANETESELLKLDVMDELFEYMYSGEGEGAAAFLELAERYGGERGDEPLYRLVGQLHEFAQSHPWPAYWLRQTAAAFEIGNARELEASPWVQSMHRDVLLALSGAESQLEEALGITRLAGGPAPYAETFDEDLSVVRHIRQAAESGSWSSLGDAFRSAAFGKLKALRGDGYDKSLQEEAKSLREDVKKLIGSIAEELFGRTSEQFVEELRELAPLMGALSELAVSFGQRYEAAKRDKGLLDFGDLEHYCLRILRDESSEPGHLVPSSAAEEYRVQFDEILLDEYQDTNMVQEAIVTLIAREGRGNLFMVGDVKQSIYRFRLAEPNLFLTKYKSYDTGNAGEQSSENGPSGEEGDGSGGLRIDLARNFRSRAEVVDGVNAVFRAMMRETVAEMDYDRRAELVCGAAYPEPLEPGSCRVQFAVLDRAAADSDEGEAYGSLAEDDEGEDGAEGPRAQDDTAELKVAQLEARWIGGQLRELMDRGFQVYDGKRKQYRSLQWRDVVILLRATQAWSPIIIEELQSMGVPAYAELSTGYFEATEVETMLSLLRVVDNPYQDIPLAAVLRSPLFGLNAEELSLIRILSPSGPYYDAVLQAAGDEAMPGESRLKLSRFLEKLDAWRQEARQGALADLLWRMYLETGYYDFMVGLPGGAQRQANLRALHDRARQYEATSFRGLFRFLRFIERMRDGGGDLGTARALGEQEDVVRIMSIHKSKGLEFPVVFVAGLGKLFNQQDLRSPFLKHKELGFGPRYVDSELRISYPSLPYLAIRRKLRMEMLAEEMRILYVALTRPKEKMYLVGTTADVGKKLQRWLGSTDSEGRLSDFRVATARSFLDWLAPMAAAQLSGSEQGRPEQHAEAGNSLEGTLLEQGNVYPIGAKPQWEAAVVPAAWLGIEAAAAQEIVDEMTDAGNSLRDAAIASLAQLEEVEQDRELRSRLDWRYPYEVASKLAAKTSVTEMKRLHEEADAYSADLGGSDGSGHADSQDDEAAPADFGSRMADRHSEAFQSSGGAAEASGGASFSLRLRRPAFMEEKSLTAAEKGSASHLLMQHVPLVAEIGATEIAATLADMVERRLLTSMQAASIDISAVAAFLSGELGQRMRNSPWVRREVPFSAMLPASRVYAGGTIEQLTEEPVLIQGVIDCMFRGDAGIVLVDYKTDRIHSGGWEAAAERHRFQLELYAEAIASVLGEPVAETYVYFFDGASTIKL